MISYLLYFFIMITFSTDPKADIDWKVCSSFSQIIQTHLKGFGSGIKGILMRQIQILIHIDRGIQIQIQPTKMMAMMMKMVIRWVQCLWWWNDDEMMTKWWWDDEYGLPAYSHHDRFPPWWVLVRDDYGGNLSGDKFPP